MPTLDPQLHQMPLYIKLFNGRTDPDEDMEDWGTDGPELGPFQSVQGTYHTHIKLDYWPGVSDEAIAAQQIDAKFPEIKYHEDMLVHPDPYGRPVYYGDYRIFALPAPDLPLSEVRIDHEEDGWIFVDVWLTCDEAEAGRTAAKIHRETGEVKPAWPLYANHPRVQEVVANECMALVKV